MRLKGSKINYEDFYAHAGDVDGKELKQPVVINIYE